MHTGQTIFSQLIDFLPKKQFDKCVRRYHGNHRIKSFSCFDQYLCMVFAQITYRQSLRDIETCLRAMKQNLYHCGIRGNVCRATLAEANENRDRRIYADFAQILIDKARILYANEIFGIQLDREVYALDSSTIDLCLSLFPWANFRQHKAAVKIHTLMNLKGSIPTFIRITDGKVHDVNILDDLVLEPGAIYVMDRGYLDFARLFTFTQNLSTFVTRAKTNFDYSVPPEYLGWQVWVRWDIHLVRIFNSRLDPIAVHAKVEPGHFQTRPDHIHEHKRSGIERGAGWPLQKADRIGFQARQWAQAMLQARGMEGLRVLVEYSCLVGLGQAS